MLQDAPPEMLARWGDSALTQVEWLVEAERPLHCRGI
jgi:hypothetical protein